MLFYLETNSKSGKTYLIATMKYTWFAYLSPPLTGINHYSLQKNQKEEPTNVTQFLSRTTEIHKYVKINTVDQNAYNVCM